MFSFSMLFAADSVTGTVGSSSLHIGKYFVKSLSTSPSAVIQELRKLYCNPATALPVILMCVSRHLTK